MWTIDKTNEVKEWIFSLNHNDREAILTRLLVLREFGPDLGRPNIDSVYGSKHSNMKELRISRKRSEYRIFFAFDPTRSAILLIGGDKRGVKRFYDDMIKRADYLYDLHLKKLEKKNEKSKK